MPVRAIAPYDFPSSSRQELYGEDQLVHLWWRDNMWFGAAACFRTPRAMTWAEFRSTVVDPWASADPDYDPATAWHWSVDGRTVEPSDDQTLDALGVGHKSLVSFHR
ncbi:phenol hydroxylase subunit P4 [Streptomyces caeni]|uniref:Phenol hydroxylase subunit P4 n=1 Tax=Streptomyces caeni TaxID=2307231 RepID=A0ABW4ISZ5_9ACTN